LALVTALLFFLAFYFVFFVFFVVKAF